MKNKLIALLFMLGGGVSALQAQNFTAASYNIRYANHNDSINGNGWGQRLPYIAELVKFHGFDIWGSQEGLYHQLQQLKQQLPGYDYIGVGRVDGVHEGEHSAIFYRTDKFELLDTGNFWLSEEQDHPNKGWDADLERICTWGKFREKATGFVFMFYNLHMDHRGVKARSESAKLVIRKICEQKPLLPAILTGDFNVDQHSESYATLTAPKVIFDSYEIAQMRYAPNGTVNGFKTDRMTKSRIDHVFVTKDFEVEKYGVLTDTYRAPGVQEKKALKDGNFPHEISFEQYIARTPSDHFPVKVVLKGKK